MHLEHSINYYIFVYTKPTNKINTHDMFDNFASRHIGTTNPETLQEMLSVIGVESVDELIAQVIPQSIRLKKPLALPKQGMSEYEYAAHIRSLAERKQGWIDFDASPVLEGEDLDGMFMDYVLEVASGRETQNERHGYREISIFKDGVTL